MPPSDLFNQAPPANLQPVEFDFSAASAAAAALRSAADAVDRGAGLRANDARKAEQHWTGGQRSIFDATENGLSNSASTLVKRLRSAADKLHDAADAADAARAENARRAHALANWHHDLDVARTKYEAAQASLAMKG